MTLHLLLYWPMVAALANLQNARVCVRMMQYLPPCLVKKSCMPFGVWVFSAQAQARVRAKMIQSLPPSSVKKKRIPLGPWVMAFCAQAHARARAKTMQCLPLCSTMMKKSLHLLIAPWQRQRRRILTGSHRSFHNIPRNRQFLNHRILPRPALMAKTLQKANAVSAWIRSPTRAWSLAAIPTFACNALGNSIQDCAPFVAHLSKQLFGPLAEVVELDSSALISSAVDTLREACDGGMPIFVCSPAIQCYVF
jgi:hypothetical protein